MTTPRNFNPVRQIENAASHSWRGGESCLELCDLEICNVPASRVCLNRDDGPAAFANTATNTKASGHASSCAFSNSPTQYFRGPAESGTGANIKTLQRISENQGRKTGSKNPAKNLALNAQHQTIPPVIMPLVMADLMAPDLYPDGVFS